MLLRCFIVLTVILNDVPNLISAVPLQQEALLLDTAESNEVSSKIHPHGKNVIIGEIVINSKDAEEKVDLSEEAREGKAATNNIRDALNVLDNTFESVDFTNAIISPDGKKECVNKTQFVETVVSDR